MTELPTTEATFRELLSALARGDVNAAAEIFAEDGTISDQSSPDVVYAGRAEITELLRSYFALLPDLTMELIDVVTAEDRLAAELILRGTPRGQDKPVAARYGVFQRYHEGKIVSERLYVDSRQMPDGL